MGAFLLLLFSQRLIFAEEVMPVAEQKSPRSERIFRFYNDVNKSTLHLIDDFYDKDVEFKDPLETFKGRDQLKKYYENMYKNVTEIHFDFSKEVVNGDHHVIFWTMAFKSEKLNGGKEIRVEGNSHIVFGGPEDKVVYHRDYFDMGAFVYRYVPMLRGMVKFVNNRLRAH